MPSPTDIPVHATIGHRSRIIHNRYGRGLVKRLFPDDGQASVQFDDDGGACRRVQLRDLAREPADMPPNVLGERAALS